MMWVMTVSHVMSFLVLNLTPQVFGPAFRRNARWSTDTNVPDVGDEASTWEQVDKFYNFWFTFK